MYSGIPIVRTVLKNEILLGKFLSKMQANPEVYLRRGSMMELFVEIVRRRTPS